MKLAALTRKHTPQPANADDDAGDRRADGTGNVDQHRIEADGVAQVRGADDLKDEGLSRGILEATDQAEQECERVDLPKFHGMRHREDAEAEGKDPHRRLQDDHEFALVDAVGDDAPVGSEDQDGKCLQRGDDAQGNARSGQLEHEPGLGNALHPGADERNRLTAEIKSVVRIAQRCERLLAE